MEKDEKTRVLLVGTYNGVTAVTEVSAAPPEVKRRIAP